jgi:ABC-type antimicrobial peptide transport system permease subunit
MKQALFKISAKSLWCNRKDALYQVIIIAILAAIICGSLLTGDSVRKSLAKSLSEKLGNSDLLISSGSRYFDASIAGRLSAKAGVNTTALLEIEGYCRNFSTGTTALNTKIFAITHDFFKFHGTGLSEPEKGTVLINESLANVLGAIAGDEVIVSFTEVDPIPSNAPFAPSKAGGNSKVFKISGIIPGSQNGNFSLGTSQSIPQNIFINIEDMESGSHESHKANRLLIQNTTGNDDPAFLKTLKEILIPSDIGLTIRRSPKTAEPELISDRIFIDGEIVDEIRYSIPETTPVITYLANSISVSGRTTPYSFISALPEFMSGLSGDDDIVISSWLADDLKAKKGDSLEITWYDPGMGKRLEEKSKQFVITDITGTDFKYSDPYLMPDFPGISGSTTCSGWDAGVPILLDNIRDKDEKYWNLYRGTPKAFIRYETGKRLWGNNFGSATALRYPAEMDTSDIIKKLTGVIDPAKAGFSIVNLREKNRKAAAEGVDFGTLFLSLSFFIILSSIILLSIALSLFFDSRKEQVRTYHSLGFRNRSISLIISYESYIISITGAIIGVILGYLVNILIIKALNGVWRGAVQTNTLTPGFSLIPFLTGFIATVLISAILIRTKLKRHIAGLSVGKWRIHIPSSGRKNVFFLILSLLFSMLLFCLSFISSDNAIAFSFAGGTLLFAGFIFALNWFYTAKYYSKKAGKKDYSRLYYSFYPSHAVTPALFLAAGIFAVIITSANRQIVSDKMLLPSGGTGGFLLWGETAIPVKYNLNSPEGRKEFGFNEPDLKELTFVQAKRLSGDDASCLNISHVTTPPILGIDPSIFIEKGSFSFATSIELAKERNPWELLNEPAKDNIIYGIADQTVLQWGLKIKTGDTLKYLSESGIPLNIVICAGLQSSVFQGYLLTGATNFEKYFPSVWGSSIFLADGRKDLSEFYINTISERLSGSGVAAEPAIKKLASFFEVTNTYLEVFMMLGAFGLILGAAGLGFILRRNFNSRKQEFALMLATGYSAGRIKNLLLKDQLIILIWGILAGLISALSATWPSIQHGADLPWGLLSILLLAMMLTGIIALLISINQVNKARLIPLLRKE